MDMEQAMAERVYSEHMYSAYILPAYAVHTVGVLPPRLRVARQSRGLTDTGQ